MTQQTDCRIAGDDHLVAEIAAAYGRPGPTAWTDLGGRWTTNLRLDYPEGPLVARIHQFSTTPERLAAVQAARIVAAEAGLPAVRPLTTSDGATRTVLSDGHSAELEPFVPWSERMNTPHLLRLGFRLLGQTHDALAAVGLPEAARTVRHANHLSSEEAAQATRRGAERIASWGDHDLTEFAEQVVTHTDEVDRYEALLRDDLVRQVVHGDFWDNNVLFTGDRVVALLDFDFMAERARIDDLALTAYFFFLEPGRGLPRPADRDLLRDFVDAYDMGTTRPLSRAERLALPLAIARQPAWSVGRWVCELDESEARDHATDAAGELPVARQIMKDLTAWQEALRVDA